MMSDLNASLTSTAAISRRRDASAREGLGDHDERSRWQLDLVSSALVAERLGW